MFYMLATLHLAYFTKDYTCFIHDFDINTISDGISLVLVFTFRLNNRNWGVFIFYTPCNTNVVSTNLLTVVLWLSLRDMVYTLFFRTSTDILTMQSWPSSNRVKPTRTSMLDSKQISSSRKNFKKYQLAIFTKLSCF